MTEDVPIAVRTASELLYSSGLIARSHEEVEVLEWFRTLTPTGKLIELARIQGMTQAIKYERAKENE